VIPLKLSGILYHIVFYLLRIKSGNACRPCSLITHYDMFLCALVLHTFLFGSGQLSCNPTGSGKSASGVPTPRGVGSREEKV
jgi:hypothetical protein